MECRNSVSLGTKQQRSAASTLFVAQTRSLMNLDNPIRAQRRSVLSRKACSWLVVVLLGLAVYANITPTAASDAAFTIAVLPDTQGYTAYDKPDARAAIFRQQTQWIAANAVTENIVFVAQTGDIVNNGATQPIEWQRADAAMDLLDGVAPYSVATGNHDYNRVGSRSSGASAYLSYFGPQRYARYAWYGGASSNKLNQYQVFQAGGWTFLHLALELEAPDSAIAWAQSVINANPGLPTIISTHSYQDDKTGRTTKAQFQGNSGEQIWSKLVRPNPQIFMVLNGHFYKEDGERSQVSTNAAGLPVFEMVNDYQMYPNGGNGYMRLIRFDPANKRIEVQSYSPYLNQFMTDSHSQFTFSVKLYERFAMSSTLTAPPTNTVTPTSTPAPPSTTPTLESQPPTPVATTSPPQPSPIPTTAPAAPEPTAALGTGKVGRSAVWLPLIFGNS